MMTRDDHELDMLQHLIAAAAYLGGELSHQTLLDSKGQRLNRYIISYEPEST